MDYIDLKPTIDAYVKLLIVQYNNKPKAQETIALLCQQLLANGIYWGVQDAYNIDTAVGKQLDILGKYIGVDRYYTGSVFPDDSFSFSDAESSPLSEAMGFIDAQDVSPAIGIFLGTQDVIAPHQTLDDTTYRLILKMKIIQNNINHSNKSINDDLYSFFGLTIYMLDNYDMTISYLAIDDPTLQFLLLAEQKGVLPRPMGVGIDILLENTYFSFADATSNVAEGQGFIDAQNLSPNPGIFLGADEIIN